MNDSDRAAILPGWSFVSRGLDPVYRRLRGRTRLLRQNVKQRRQKRERKRWLPSQSERSDRSIMCEQ